MKECCAGRGRDAAISLWRRDNVCGLEHGVQLQAHARGSGPDLAPSGVGRGHQQTSSVRFITVSYHANALSSIAPCAAPHDDSGLRRCGACPRPSAWSATPTASTSMSLCGTGEGAVEAGRITITPWRVSPFVYPYNISACNK
jgi:hypothetical protein